jgi:predicted ArsR family transcriptional regulator
VSSLQIQARAMGDPTRHKLFRYVADAGHPIGVAELTAHFELNHNAIRQHLAKLVDACLLVEATAAPSGRGRPRLEYSIDPHAESRWGVTGPYERLSLLLSEMIRTGEQPVEIGRRAGLRRRLSDTPDDQPLEAFVGAMSAEGFDPTVRERGDSIEVRLATCPFVSAALADPDTVCTLHLGLAQGLAEAVGGIEVDELIPNDPRQANCRLRCHVSKEAGSSEQ